MTKKLSKTIYQHVKDYLEKNSDVVKNKSDLARVIGVPWNSIHTLLAGNDFLSDQTIKKIADFFGEDEKAVRKECSENIQSHMRKRREETFRSAQGPPEVVVESRQAGATFYNRDTPKARPFQRRHNQT